MKINFLNFLKVFFTRVNLSKIVIIFSVGLISRILVHHFLDINVFIDFLHPFSVAYYFVFASFIVFINELFSTFNLSIFPDFLELFSRIPKFSSLLSSLTFFKFDYFKLSSIRHLFTQLYSRFYSYHTITDQKLLNDANDTLDDSLVLHKNPDDHSKGKNLKGKGRASSTDNGESSRYKGKGKASAEPGESSRSRGQETVSNNEGKSNLLFNGTTPAWGAAWGSTHDNSRYYSRYVSTATSTTGLATESSEQIPYENSMSHRRHISELDSNAVYELESSTSNQYNSRELDSNPVYEAPDNSNSVYEAPDNSVGYRQVPVTTRPPVIDSSTKPILPAHYNQVVDSRVSRPYSASSSFNSYYSNDTNHGTVGSFNSYYSNHTNQATVGNNPNSNNMYGNNASGSAYNYIVPYGNPSTDSSLNNGVSVNRSIDMSLISSEEFAVRVNVQGELKLGIERIQGESDISKIYLKYKNLSKRKFYWHLWGKNRNGFDSYAEFKRAWDPKTPVMKSIFKEVKADISNEIKKLIETERPWETPTIYDRNRANITNSRSRRVNR